MYRLLLVAISLVPSLARAQTPAPRPNIVLVLADDMGFSDLGCYGGEIATPNLDKLAARGLRFTQMYNTSKCFPSRACLLTGAYAQQVNMARRPGRIESGVTLGQVLRSAGYRTLMSGKHHGTQNPFEIGFDRYFGLRDGACNYFNPGRQRDGEPKPAQKRARRAWCIDAKTYRPYTPKSKKFYTTDAFTDHALAYLDEYKGEDKPFFLYLAFNAPHDPLQAWPEDIRKYEGNYDVGWKPIRDARYAKQIELGLFGSNAPLSRQEFGDWDALSDAAKAEEARRMEVYAAMIDRLDQNVGRLVRKLEQLGELDNTLILFASDNGGSAEVVRIGTGEIGSMTRWASVKRNWANVSNTPFRKFKNHSHEGGICTPLIAFWPKRIHNQGAIVRTPLHFIDFMATLVELSGATYPEEYDHELVVPMQGVSFAPAFVGDPISRKAPLFWQWGSGKAIRDGRWKLISQRGPWRLFDMETDRTETVDLAGQHPERVTRMAAQWQAWYDGTPAGKRKNKR